MIFLIFNLILIAICLITGLIILNRKRYILAFFAPRIKAINGYNVDNIVPVVPGKTIFGNTFDLLGLSDVETFSYKRWCCATMKRNYILYIFGFTIYNIIEPDDLGIVFTDTNFITKSKAYDFLIPILGEGLLISTNRKWHERRKLLTPAFHFSILNGFLQIFKEESEKFVKHIESLDMDCITISDIVPKLTLNVICETALGVKLDECLNEHEYRESVKMFEKSFNRRVANPHLIYDWMYNIFVGSKYERHIRNAHQFSSDIIKKRRNLMHNEMKNSNTSAKKKHYALLDILLLAEQDDLIDHSGICEEVDTFMFEGFDTTSMALIFCLMNLSIYSKEQERCYQEIAENLDIMNDLNELDINKLNNLKYLECFIKETLRLYPSVPVIGRQIEREMKLSNGLILPANTQIFFHIFDIQRNEKYFTKSNEFQPDRFLNNNINDNTNNNGQTFSFIPFSAGQRNCIGQKFAMLEIKTILVYIIKHYQLLPLMDPKQLEFETGIIIRVKNKINVKFERRCHQ